MRAVFLSFLVMIAAVGGAEARIRWQGMMYITASSGTCADYDPKGSTLVARFRPAGISDNGSNSLLTAFYVSNPYGQSFALQNGSFTSAFKTVDTMTMGDGFGPSDNPVSVKFTKISPTPSATAQFLNITGQIKGWDYMSACTVTFNLALVQRP